MEKLTLHRILSELKTIDDRIKKATDDLMHRAVKRGNQLIINGRKSNMSETEFTEEAKATYQSVTDLIKRKFVLKSALLKANATTKVTIAGVEYTIIEAIEMKSLMDKKASLLQRMKRVNNSVDLTFNDTVEQANTDFERLLSAQITGLTNKSDIAKVREDYKVIFDKANTVTIVDPIESSEIIKSLEKEIEDFKVNVDSALSEINATTAIEIEG
jgi:hypothetical protein